MSVAASASKPKAQPLQGQDILSGDFDKSQFNQELNLLALKVPCSSIGPVRKKLEKSKLLLNIPRVKPIRNIPENKGEKLILLHESCTDPKDARLEEICQDLGLEPLSFIPNVLSPSANLRIDGMERYPDGITDFCRRCENI